MNLDFQRNWLDNLEKFPASPPLPKPPDEAVAEAAESHKPNESENSNDDDHRRAEAKVLISFADRRRGIGLLRQILLGLPLSLDLLV